MDVKNLSPLLPHRHAEELNSQQDRLMGAIEAIKAENRDAAASQPFPLHSLLASLDAIQGAQELESFGHQPQPAFDVDINSAARFRELDKDAFTLELNYHA